MKKITVCILTVLTMLIMTSVSWAFKIDGPREDSRFVFEADKITEMVISNPYDYPIQVRIQILKKDNRVPENSEDCSTGLTLLPKLITLSAKSDAENSSQVVRVEPTKKGFCSLLVVAGKIDKFDTPDNNPNEVVMQWRTNYGANFVVIVR